jgi:MarR family 2-MHQ and catechol resistance regulon transcriptional repressor
VIGRKLLKSSGNMTLVIDNPGKRDLVCRDRADYDHRVMLLSLTDTGRELIESTLSGS